MIVVDIWGGYNSMDHLARFYKPLDEALIIAAKELNDGFLVNLRKEAHFGIQENWDRR